MLEWAGIREYYKKHKAPLQSAIESVLASGNYIGKEVVSTFEQKFSEYLGGIQVVSCGNGTDALRLALMALGVSKGDGVLVPSFNFVAGAEAIVSLGAIPIFVEVDKNHCIDILSVQRAIEYSLCQGKIPLRGIIAVDMFGFVPNYPELEKICSHYDLFLIEDAAQSIGGNFFGRPTGTFGTLAITSFFPTKPLACFGDGGAVLCQNPYLCAKIRAFANHGTVGKRYNHQYVGINSRLDALQAAVLIQKLETLNADVAARRRAAKQYNSLLLDSLHLPQKELLSSSSMGAYTLVLPSEEERDSLREYLTHKNIPTMVYYPTATHQLIPYMNYPIEYGGLCHTQALCSRVLSLPIHPFLSKGDIAYICKWVNAHQRKECDAAIC